MAWSDEDRPTVAQRRAVGRAARKATPRSSHGAWQPAADRRDPIELLEEQSAQRLPWLAPVRRGRMVATPFTFYRGAARVMAWDLAATPDSGLRVQACGDAHLSNFGAYASPERQLVFDANDFDETLPGPWEWDLKRLVASFTIAARQAGVDDATRATIAGRAVSSYREAMDRFADMDFLALWYDDMPVEAALAAPDLLTDQRDRARLERFERKAKSKDNLQALRKLTVEVDGQYRIRSDPPVLVPLEEVIDEWPEQAPGGWDADLLHHEIQGVLAQYRASLPDHRAALLDRYAVIDAALKVVGVGSVGTRCFVALLEGRDREDPLFLQVKEAGRSVLAEHLPASRYRNQGRRVVEGQRLMQAASDVFLGWTRGPAGRDFYVRQLRDWKGSVDVDSMSADRLGTYARLCGWTLARGHARSGDAAAIAGYVGTGDVLDRALVSFAEAYADQNEADHAAFAEAIADGRLAADVEG